jgi:putative FmdB family regulatory protein
MPTYEYACKSCGEHLEVVQSFKDDPLRVCPNCDGELRKVFSPIGITFKGSGFYKNDSRSSSSSSSKSSESSSSSSSSESSSSKSESKSETSSTKSDAKSDSSSSTSKSSESKAASAS